MTGNLQLLDVLLTLLHLAIIGFNLFGWIWAPLRKAHFISILLTAASWLLLGYWYGLGYCPITDWQWRIKEQLGERGLPASFIKYFADKVSGENLDASLVDTLTTVFFAIAAALSVYVNFFRKRRG
ncbi:uncharacterized protein DUF2784 [Anseongella ginsenosidimutans]|uniref:Uncharacterized protein DUF2784 n=1 Tax=Anseongella ginsenosidimutans TaxID=496056 RepID=A0A4R3KSB1_9SPHI|nr:DUF2784 domain-containing protein [Anseongella ginsenosidimutans]QEC53096.1 DUF2784 domain-containing protein [Anseongella ginsenosidimutans]TCS87713.1 uncharacterized protein DUF2784 [Anseongella ginsenosidimutans]